LGFYGDDCNTTNNYPDHLEWHHWILTYDVRSLTQSIFRDGLLVGRRRSYRLFHPTGSHAATMRIGAIAAWGDSNMVPFMGHIYDFRCWTNVVVSDQQADAIKQQIQHQNPIQLIDKVEVKVIEATMHLKVIANEIRVVSPKPHSLQIQGKIPLSDNTPYCRSNNTKNQ